jgi:hypothetical protein
MVASSINAGNSREKISVINRSPEFDIDQNKG